MEEKPGHLASMHVPERHVRVDCFHIGRNYFDGAVIAKRQVLEVEVVEESGSKHGTVEGSIEFGLVGRIYG